MRRANEERNALFATCSWSSKVLAAQRCKAHAAVGEATYQGLNFRCFLNLLHSSQPRRQRPLHPRRPRREMFTCKMDSLIRCNTRKEIAEAHKCPCAARPLVVHPALRRTAFEVFLQTAEDSI